MYVAVARKNQRAEIRLVDEDGSSLVVGTTLPNWEGGFGIIIYMLSQSRPSANGQWSFLHFHGAFHRGLIREKSWAL